MEGKGMDWKMWEGKGISERKGTLGKVKQKERKRKERKEKGREVKE